MEQSDVAACVFFMPENLGWEGGLNKAILVQTGQQLDDYILEHVVRPKRGDVYVIPSMVADRPRLVLGILPRWDGGMDDEERAYKKCLREVLVQAEESGFPSLALPALGLGNKEFPPRKAARLTMNIFAAHRYSVLQEIRIICKTPEIFAAYDLK